MLLLAWPIQGARNATELNSPVTEACEKAGGINYTLITIMR